MSDLTKPHYYNEGIQKNIPRRDNKTGRSFLYTRKWEGKLINENVIHIGYALNNVDALLGENYIRTINKQKNSKIDLSAVERLINNQNNKIDSLTQEIEKQNKGENPNSQNLKEIKTKIEDILGKNDLGKFKDLENQIKELTNTVNDIQRIIKTLNDKI